VGAGDLERRIISCSVTGYKPARHSSKSGGTTEGGPSRPAWRR